MWEVCEEGKMPWGALSNADVISVVVDQQQVLNRPISCTTELYNLMLRYTKGIFCNLSTDVGALCQHNDLISERFWKI
jgi:hypothetical protein